MNHDLIRRLETKQEEEEKSIDVVFVVTVQQDANGRMLYLNFLFNGEQQNYRYLKKHKLSTYLGIFFLQHRHDSIMNTKLKTTLYDIKTYGISRILINFFVFFCKFHFHSFSFNLLDGFEAEPKLS